VSEREVSILVLAYNEAGNLPGAIDDIRSAAMALDDYEIIVVDDGSTDGTGLVADKLAAKYADVLALHHPENRGLRAGYETGLAEARMRRVVWLPADREMTAGSIERIFEAVGTADIVSLYHGNPAAREWFRRALTFVSTLEMNLLFGHDKKYFQGCTVYPTELARSLPRTEAGFFVMAEQYLAALDYGLSVVEVPIVHQARTYGTSSAVGWGRIWHAQMAVLRFWYRQRVRVAFEAMGFSPEAVR
jgi:glycosyltransferase involved in cell wall biosynthesis